MINSPDACNGTCYWKQDEGKCLLHVKDVVDLSEKPGERMVSTPELFTRRIIDELVRFPVRRNQLMKKGEISKVSAIVQPIHQGDQYIIPESSITWTNLLRLDWTRQVLEEPKYYEEMSRELEEEKAQGVDGLPDELLPLFGEDSGFYVDIPQKIAGKPFAPFAALLGVTLEQMGMMEDDRDLTLKHMIQYVNATNLPIGLIDARDNLKIGFARPRMGTFDTVTIIVYWENKIGVLIQEEGNFTVRAATLPSRLQEKWENAHMPPIVKQESPVVEEIQMIMAPGKNPVMAKQRRRPLVAQFPQAPLVEAPIVEKQRNNKQQKRRPRIGVLPSFVEPKAQVQAPARKRPQIGTLPSQIASQSVSMIPESAIKRSGKKPQIGVL
jgi:hypothetical protein